LELAGLTAEPIPVDAEGLCVDEGIVRAPDALVALVTPGQQAPLGAALSSQRRRDLLRWAKAQNAWIVEDDYLGELQLDGHTTPALASGIGAERVIHIGTFSKTMSPALGLGFVVVPKLLAEKFVAITAVLLPAPTPASPTDTLAPPTKLCGHLPVAPSTLATSPADNHL
jgi:GntR family transcriptional regulator/MocR family aminotransferase